MKRFFRSLAGSFAGKLLATLVIAVLVALGIGPDRWAAWLFGIPTSSAFIARYVLILVAILTLGLLVTAIIVSRPNKLSNRRRLNRAWQRLRITFKLLKRRIVRYWLLRGPQNYEVTREIVAIGHPYYPAYRESRIEFSHRFSDAFPGIRDLLVLEDSIEIIHRLNVLLRWPLVAWSKTAERGATPFYWTTGSGNMHIYRYRRYKRRIVLINEKEIIPRYLAAIPGAAYWQNYVYLESEALPSLLIRGEEDLEPSERQEYAVYNGRIFNRSEYDDGGYMLRGKPVRFSHRPDIRSRRTAPFGLLLLPVTSPANQPGADRTLEQLIQRVVADKNNLQGLINLLLSLPKGE